MSNTPNSGSEATSVPSVAGAAVRYISCSQEEMVQIEIEAWSSGADHAHNDGVRALRELAAIEQRAELACEEALETYVPIDLARFHDVFTLAWIAGYWTARGPGSH
jgi:hypothetical protein